MERLTEADAGELLTLQRAAYATEAQAHSDPFLPPLTESLDAVRAALRDPAQDRDRPARGRPADRHGAADVNGDSAEVGRLAVAPDRQGQGLGSALLRALEAEAPAHVRELRLFTGEHSASNLRLYERFGYRETHRAPERDHALVFLSKPWPPH